MMDIGDSTELTELLALLGNARHRFVLYYLAATDRPVERRGLAEAIATWEDTDSEPTAGAIEAVSLSLFHYHLQSLDDAGLVDYDATSERVELAATRLTGLSIDEQLQRERDRMLRDVR